MTPSRSEFLHITPGEQALFYALTALSVAIMAAQIWRRAVLWRSGKPISWRPQGVPAIWSYVLGQRKVRSSRRRSGSPMHLMIFYGFLGLFLATTLLAVNKYSPWKFHAGAYYLAYEATFDALGLLFVVGIAWALARRTWFRPASLSSSSGDFWGLALLLALGVSGYGLEAARIANKAAHLGSAEWFDRYSFVGYALAQPLGALSDGWYKGLWWFHFSLVFAFFAVLPRLGIRHLVVAIFAAYGRENAQMGELKPVSIEEVEQTGKIGVSSASDYSRWHLMSLDACMECGRCTEVCPANAVGKVLNPKRVVQDIRGAMVSGASVADAVSEEALWACTACNACVEACPVLIRHVDLIVDARRNLVAEGRLSGTGATMLRQMGSSGHAWGHPASSREDWMRDLEVPLCRDVVEFEYLFWVGCAGATEPGAVKTTRAVAKLLHRAGVRFACLGHEEACTGDPARRIGDEFLFQEKAQGNAAVFRKYGVQKVVTACPHCFNTLRNEYGAFGAQLEVLHHSQLLGRLIAEKRLRSPEKGAPIVLHDPCYLARVNGESEAPRVALGGPDPTLEPPNRGAKTLCCGAGGGRMWMDEAPDQRPGNRRAEELLATGADQIAVACPFCRIMLDASVKQIAKREVRLLDIAEVMAEANS